MERRTANTPEREMLTQSFNGYGSIEVDTPTNDTHNMDLIDFPSSTRRRVALGAILACQVFDWATFTMLTVWIPQTLELNSVFLIQNQTQENMRQYYANVYRVQRIPVIGLILICSCSLIAGICMDSFFKKSRFMLVSIFLATVGCSVIAALLADVANNLVCTTLGPGSNASAISCSLASSICKDSYNCLVVYLNCVYGVCVLNSVIRTTLATLGGDQIPERNGVRVFYARFYWCQKAGEFLATLAYIVFLLFWVELLSKNYYKASRNFLVYGFQAILIIFTLLTLLALLIVVCGKVTRHVYPDISVIKDTYGIWCQGYKRKRERQEEDRSCLDVAKISRGGDFLDQAVNDRIQLNRFSVVLLLLIPVTFAVTLPSLSKTYTRIDVSLKQRLTTEFYDSLSAGLLYLIKLCTAIIAIPVIHKICTSMVKNGHKPTFLHRIICGHVAMMSAATVGMITSYFNFEYNVKNFAAPMILLGLCSAFIYTAGYELTMISAPRAMQGTAMGMFYSVDAIANLINLALRSYINSYGLSISKSDYYIVNGVGGVLCVGIAAVVLAILQRRYDLGLHRV